MQELNVGFITSNSFSSTCKNDIEKREYNSFRAHGLGVVDVSAGLGVTTLYDIGESKSKSSPYLFNEHDDLTIHINSSKLEGSLEITFDEFLNLPGKHVVFMLYVYMASDPAREYIVKYLTDSRLDGIIYYASDDEMYYRGYFLEGLICDYHGRFGGLGIYPKIKDKLIAIISGHNYCRNYTHLCTNCYFLPMYPNQDYKSILDFEYNCNLSESPKYDFFLNCFHDSRMLERIFKHLDKHSFLVITNEVVNKYIDRTKLPKGTEIIVFEGRNVPLSTIVKLVKKCRVYYLPNTYVHLDSWYETHYVQDTMYTHKYLEAYYANVPVISGDISDDTMIKLNNIDFKTNEPINTIRTTLDSTLLTLNISKFVMNNRVKQIVEYIESWLRKNQKVQ